MRLKALLLSATLLPVPWGCGESVERLEPVPLEKLPPGSLEAATKAVRGFKVDRARKSRFNGQDSIEIIGKDKSGKIVEVEVSTEGKVLEVE